MEDASAEDDVPNAGRSAISKTYINVSKLIVRHLEGSDLSTLTYIQTLPMHVTRPLCCNFNCAWKLCTADNPERLRNYGRKGRRTRQSAGEDSQQGYTQEVPLQMGVYSRFY